MAPGAVPVVVVVAAAVAVGGRGPLDHLGGGALGHAGEPVAAAAAHGGTVAQANHDITLKG